VIFINENEEFESPIEFVPHDNVILINGEYFREIEDKHVPGIRPKSFYISINGEIYNAVTHRISRGAFGKGHRYCAIELVKIDGSRISIMLHRLLMIVFNFNEDFKNLEVNHISGNKRDNSLYNLEWTDHAGNMQHAYDHNLIKSGESTLTRLSNYLNFLSNQNLALVKISVEGLEEKIIQGGIELITRYHVPYIYLEFNPESLREHGTDPIKFLKIFTRNKYKFPFYNFFDDEFLSIDEIMTKARRHNGKINLYIAHAKMIRKYQNS
jgi:hypothetical protein